MDGSVQPGLRASSLAEIPARALLRSLPAGGALVVDPDLRVVLCEGGIFATAGWDPRFIEGRVLSEILPAPAWAQLGPRYEAALAGETSGARYRAQDGRLYDFVVSPLERHGVVVGAFAVTIDANREEEAEQRLREAQTVLRAAFDAAGTATVVFDVSQAGFGDIVQANAATTRLFGYAESDVVGGNLRAVFPPEAADTALAGLRRLAVEGGAVQALERELIDVDGRRLWVRLHVTFVRDDLGEAQLGVAQIEDVTKERLREEALRFSQDRFGLVFHQAPVGMVMVDVRPGAAGLILEANEAYAELVGRPLRDLPGMTLRELTHPGDVERDDEVLAALGSGATEIADLEKRFVRPDGTLRTSQVRVGLVRDDAGSPLYALRVAVDTTDRLQAEAEWTGLLESVFEAVMGLDAEGRVTVFNRAAETLFGMSRDAVVGRSAIELFVPEELRDGFRGNAVPGGPRQMPLLRGDGSRFPAEVMVQRAGGGSSEMTACVRDLTTERQADRRREGAEALFRTLFEDSAIPMAVLNLGGLCLEANPELCRFLGRSPEELRRCTIADVTHPEDHVPTDQVVAALREHGPLRREKRFVRGDGEVVWGVVHTSLLLDDHGEPRGLQAQIVDVTERREVAARLGSLLGSLAEGVVVADASGAVDNVNQAACRMLGYAEVDLVGRPVARLFPGEDMSAVASVLGSGVPLQADDAELVRADGALLPVSYSASPIGSGSDRGVVVVFNDISDRKARERTLHRRLAALDMLERTRDALLAGRLVLHSQPILDIASGQVAQEELLLRMRAEDGTLIPPGEFLPLAEEYGLIGDIDRWVIGEAAKIAGRGRHVEVNVSGRTLGHRDLASWVEDAISVSGADPRNLTFEITETALTNDLEQASRFADQVARLGCNFALDDFGTGYGSFTLLKRLPVSYLKIDMEFVRSLVEEEADRHVVQAIVSLAKGLGMATIAEGVERQETLDLLARLGVDYAQGYLIGRPAEV